MNICQIVFAGNSIRRTSLSFYKLIQESPGLRSPIALFVLRMSMACHFVFLFSLSPARVPVGLAVLFTVSLSILVRPLKVIELYPEACFDSSRSDSFIVSSKLGLHISYWEVNTKTQEKNEHETDRRSIVVTDKGIHFLGLANLLISDVIVSAGLFLMPRIMAVLVRLLLLLLS